MNVTDSIANKVIALILIPALTALATTVAAALTLWLENVTGADLDDGQITALCISTVVLVGGATATGLLTYLHKLDVWQKLVQFGATDVNLPKEKDLADELAPDELTTLPPDEGDAGRP